MVNLKKSNFLSPIFVLFLTFIFLISCGEKKIFVNKIEGKQIAITNTIPEVSQVDAFIKPYREKIDKDMNEVLAYAPETLEKSKGEWQTTIGSLQADITLASANKIFKTRENKSVDVCLLNHGGIRSVISKGNVTTRTAFELMPFENSLVVVALKGEQIIEMVDYIINEKKPHPLAGLSFVIDQNNNAKNIWIKGNPVDVGQIYYVATNDYLYNGGDSMNFFKKGVQVYDLDYKLRNVWIDYFKEVDTIPVIKDVRIKKE
ncbi:5'-nucleotidase C-terminal domain-containing protein [Flavobacterium sp. PLA-1-15]|uniref:5'-nucleotidase C-terminal domain-containing protein n=1 Tax=Flavobacterium sp. PLA-1-15 TaxID=3380533 RepID=UPI003B78E4CF